MLCKSTQLCIAITSFQLINCKQILENIEVIQRNLNEEEVIQRNLNVFFFKFAKILTDDLKIMLQLHINFKINHTHRLFCCLYFYLRCDDARSFSTLDYFKKLQQY